MKTLFNHAARVLLFTLVTFATVHAKTTSTPGSGTGPQFFTISIPDALQSQIERKDFENESIFNFKNGNDAAFLFSITRVSTEEWLTVKTQISNYKILKNENGVIVFLQQTTKNKIKGAANAQYQQALAQMQGVIESIHVQ